VACAPEAEHHTLGVVGGVGGASPVGTHLSQMGCMGLKQKIGQRLKWWGQEGVA